MYTALNISNSSIKLLTTSDKKVKKWGSSPLEAGLVRDGLILQPDAVGEAIDALFKSTGAPRNRVVTSLTGLSFIYRFLSLPRMKPSLQEEAIQRAAGREISLPLEELYLSWQATGIRDEEQDFLILGVPRHIIDSLTQTFGAAGLEPYLMDLNPLALARAAGRREAIIANLEPSCFDIVLVAEGVPAIMHTITPREEGATLEDNIRRLADELSRTLGFYQSNHPENRLSPTTTLLLSGDLAEDATASGLLQTEVDYPIESLAPPLESPPEMPTASYIINMGLALKKVPPKKAAARGEGAGFLAIDVNLLAGKYRKPKAKPLPVSRLLLILLLIAATALLYPLYQERNRLGAENAHRQDELEAVTRELNLARLFADEASRKEAVIRSITANATVLEEGFQSLLYTENDFTGKLLLITELLPPGTSFSDIEINGEEITLRGETDDPFSVVSYATDLETDGAFSEVRITIIDETTLTAAGEDAAPAGETVMTFEVTMKNSRGEN